MAEDLEHFAYSHLWTNPEDMPSLGYSKSWLSRNDFPTIELDEDNVRADMQLLFDEIAEYMNKDLYDFVQTAAGRRVALDDLTPEERAQLKGEDGFSPAAAVSKAGTVTTLTVTDKDGTTTAEIHDGNVSFSDLTPAQQESLKGDPGETGNGILSVTKTGTVGLIDTYTIYFTDGSSTTFTLTNGRPGDAGSGIASIEKISTSGLTDTYEIVLTDGDSFTFNVQNGRNGQDGATGATGQQGVTFTPHVVDGQLTWTNDGGLANPDPMAVLTQLALDQALGSISLSVSQEGSGDGATASITLQVGSRTMSGQILLDGNLNVSGQLSADELYSAKGDIADLSVDRLCTSRRIVRYLAGDTGDDNYLVAEDEVLSFMSGVYAGGTTQAKNPSGLDLYWESDPTASGVVIGTDGYPYRNGVRIFTTTTNTGYPVRIYTYNELEKASFAFRNLNGTYYPVLTLGAGDTNGRDKATIVKRVNGLEINYVDGSGKTIGLKAGLDGYLDLVGLRKVTALDFSRIDTDGTFYVTQEGNQRSLYTVTKNANGYITQITGGGLSVPVAW